MSAFLAFVCMLSQVVSSSCCYFPVPFCLSYLSPCFASAYICMLHRSDSPSYSYSMFGHIQGIAWVGGWLCTIWHFGTVSVCCCLYLSLIFFNFALHISSNSLLSLMLSNITVCNLRASTLAAYERTCSLLILKFVFYCV